MGSSESLWMGDPTSHSLERKRGGSALREEALGKEGRLWAKGKLGRSQCWLLWRTDRDPRLKLSGQHFPEVDKELRDRRPPGARRPDVRLTGGSNLPHHPAQLFPAILKVDRATSHFSFLFILCWGIVGQQRRDSFKCADSSVHTCTCAFSSSFPMQTTT